LDPEDLNFDNFVYSKMAIHPYSHIITAAEISAIKRLGYQMEGLEEGEEHFINTSFPNCDLFRLLSEIGNLLTSLGVGKIEKLITLSNTHPPTIEIFFWTLDYADKDTGLTLARTFTWEDEELIVKHDFFRLPRVHRGKGIARQVFGSFLQQYVNMGVRKIRVHAALEDGGYVWARNFFTADSKEEVTKILNSAESALMPGQFKAVKRIYENYYTKNADGESFPIQKWAELPFMKPVLRGSDWHGSIDLKNKEQFSKFVMYVVGEI
jgi:hypothetical protein